MIAKLQRGNASSSSAPGPSPKNERPRYPPRKEHYASNLPPKPRGKFAPPRRENRPPASQDSLAKLEAVTALPHKDGRIDMDAYGKYKEGGLRRKIHDAIRAKKCIRCFQEGHLRSSCQIPPRSWKEDFNKGKDSFWKPKQVNPARNGSSLHLVLRETTLCPPFRVEVSCSIQPPTFLLVEGLF
jgi:hypothetical protein